MDVNSISNTSTATSSYGNTSKKSVSSKESTYGTDTAAVYEQSSDVKNAASNKALAQKLKADAENRVSQMRSLVEDMLTKQGHAINKADDMWKILASGNFTVDSATAKEAQAAISDDGYWGVNQTSQRIFDFALSLSGGDSEQMDKMLEAFKKGFSQATKTWGGALPDISSRTYDAVLEKFESYKNNNTATE